MDVTLGFLTIKQAAQHVNKSEQTIRRLVKHHVATSHVRVEPTAKGQAYLISQTFLTAHYALASAPEEEQLLVPSEPAPEPAVARLQQLLAERDQTIQQLQHRLLEQNDVLNALTSQVNSQRIGRIEELLLGQNEQLEALQQRLPVPSAPPEGPPASEPARKGFWQRVFGK